MIDHLDESGAPCRRHPLVTFDALLALAAVGSAMPGLRHEACTKLQIVISPGRLELFVDQHETQPRTALANARGALDELLRIIVSHRSFPAPQARARIALDELMRLTAQRTTARTLASP